VIHSLLAPSSCSASTDKNHPKQDGRDTRSWTGSLKDDRLAKVPIWSLSSGKDGTVGKLFLLIRTSRPPLWILGPFVFFAFLPIHAERFAPLPVLQLILLSFPFCIFLYGINDAYDYESDQINPRRKRQSLRPLEPKERKFVKQASAIAFLLFVMSSVITLNPTNMLGMFLLLFFSYFYSAPPIRFKEWPPFDSVVNGIIYLLGPALLALSCGANILEVPGYVYLLALSVMGIHSFSTVMDYTPDKQAGYRTFAVVFGKRTAAFAALIAFVVPRLFGDLGLYGNAYLVFWSILALLLLIYPSEVLAKVLFYSIFLSFALGFVIIGHLYNWVY